MKHFDKIESMLIEVFREEWMDDSDWEEFKIEIQKEGINFETMSEQIDTGLKKGYSVDFQINSCKIILQTLKGK